MNAFLENNQLKEKTMIQESREDAEAIAEVMKKVPANRKAEAIRIIEGFALGAAMHEKEVV